MIVCECLKVRMIKLFWGEDSRLFVRPNKFLPCMPGSQSFVKTTCGEGSELLLFLCNVIRYSRTSVAQTPLGP